MSLSRPWELLEVCDKLISGPGRPLAVKELAARRLATAVLFDSLTNKFIIRLHGP